MCELTNRLLKISAAALAGVFLTFAVAEAAGMMSFPMHGNWCGPNHPNNAMEASYPPVDPLDEACMRHDICYVVQGEMDCGCDIALMNNLKSIRYPNPVIEEKARTIYDAIGLMPCSNPMGMAYKQSCVWRDMAQDMVSGRQAPWNMPLRFGKLGLTVMENKLRRGW